MVMPLDMGQCHITTLWMLLSMIVFSRTGLGAQVDIREHLPLTTLVMDGYKLLLYILIPEELGHNVARPQSLGRWESLRETMEERVRSGVLRSGQCFSLVLSGWTAAGWGCWIPFRSSCSSELLVSRGSGSLCKGSGTVEGSQPTSLSSSLAPSMGVLMRVPQILHAIFPLMVWALATACWDWRKSVAG